MTCMTRKARARAMVAPSHRVARRAPARLDDRRAPAMVRAERASAMAAAVGSPTDGSGIWRGGHTDCDAYAWAYTPRNAMKNMASEATNTTMPMTELLVPPMAR